MANDKKVYYNKLVRDKIPEKITAGGEACEVRTIVDYAEFEQELRKKIREEADGLAMVTDRAAFLQEYADLMVVLDALTAHYEIAEAELQVAMTENIAKKGLYKERHFLHWSAAGTYRSNETPQGMQ